MFLLISENIQQVYWKELRWALNAGNKLRKLFLFLFLKFWYIVSHN